MSLLDLIVIICVLVASLFIALPGGVAICVVGALIVERLLKGERLKP